MVTSTQVLKRLQQRVLKIAAIPFGNCLKHPRVGEI